MPILSLIAVATILQTQGAPSDVPKNHWAFPAVDTLFREGLLKGYPAGKQPALKLDKTIKQDLKQAEVLVLSWMDKGILHEYLSHRPRVNWNPSNYELAVGVHAAWFNAQGLLKDSKTSKELREEVLGQLQTMVKVISMFEPELTKLGADPEQMITKVNDLYQSQYRLFHGDR